MGAVDGGGVSLVDVDLRTGSGRGRPIVCQLLPGMGHRRNRLTGGPADTRAEGLGGGMPVVHRLCTGAPLVPAGTGSAQVGAPRGLTVEVGPAGGGVAGATRGSRAVDRAASRRRHPGSRARGDRRSALSRANAVPDGDLPQIRPAVVSFEPPVVMVMRSRQTWRRRELPPGARAQTAAAETATSAPGSVRPPGPR